MESIPVTQRRPWVLPFRLASEIEPEDTRFLWDPYIPLGAITLIGGKGGVGKSTLVCDIAARLSTGRPLPGHAKPYPPMKMLMVSAEDDLSHKIVPRLLSYGADMTKIGLSDEVFALDDPHVGGIEEAMRQFEATIVFIDPIVAYMGSTRDMNKSNETRDFMVKLGKIARGQDKAVVAVAHARKNGGLEASIDDVMGSADFVNAARSGILVYERMGKKIFLHDKANWSRKGPTLTFCIHDNEVEWLDYEEEKKAGRISTTPKSHGKAKGFILDTLTGGPARASDVISWGTTLGINEAALMKAKQGIARSVKVDKEWVWGLEMNTEQEIEIAWREKLRGEKPKPVGVEPPKDSVEDPAIAAILAAAKQAIKAKQNA